MFSTIQEGMDAYRDEVRKYSQRTKDLVAQGYTSITLSNPDRIKLTGWGNKLDGMATALGLSDEEKMFIEDECGIVPYK